jgi:isocitrate/isopropylmalate dehydrogenase
MMLSSSLGRPDAASAIEAAVSAALDAGWRTADLADPADPDDGLVVVGTTGMATAVVDALEAAAGVPA